MEMNDDPWSWTKASPTAAPLGAQIKPSEASMPAPAPADTTDQQLLSLATPSINGAIKGGYKGYTDYQAAQAAMANAPLSANTVIGTAAPAMTSAPAIATPATAALTEAGISGLAAPMMSTPLAMAVPATEAVVGGTLAAVPTAAATTAAAGTAAATTAAGATGTGALAGAAGPLAAMGPVGWAIAAGLLAKTLLG